MKFKKILAAVLTVILVLAAMPAVKSMAASDYVYGNLAYLTYEEYFNSELGANQGVEGDYDTISTATTKKYKSYVNAAYQTDENTGVTKVYGIKDVPVRIKREDYNAALAGENAAIKALTDRGFTESASDLSVYKDISSSGEIAAYTGLNNNDIASEAKSLISTDTVWGNYILYIYPNDGSSLDTGKNIEGAYMTTTEGKSYPIYHTANLWFQAYEFAWTIDPNFTEPHGNKPYTKSLEGLTGKTVSSVTYIYKTVDEAGNAKFTKNTYNVGALKVKKLLGDNNTATASEANANNNKTSTISLNLPADSNYTVANVGDLVEGTDYTVAASANGFDISYGANVPAGSYTVTLTDANYEDLKVESVVSADMTAGDIAIENNALVIKNDNIKLDDFLKALSKASLKINGEEINNGASVLFNDDGTVNLMAKTSGRGSKELFPELASYEIELDVPGYGLVSGIVVKSEETVSSSDANVENAEVAADTASVAAYDTSNTITKTSDNSNLLVFAVIALVSMSIIAVTEFVRRKRA